MTLSDGKVMATARVAAVVISSPHLGVFAVTAARALCAFPYVVDALPEQFLPADLVRSPLSLLFLELSGYCLNVVQRHVYAADVLVRCGVDRDAFR
jgi:hypothetical protein